MSVFLPPPGQLYFALHRGGSLISLLIEFQTRGDYSHVSILLPDRRQVEAWWDGVQVRDQFDPHDSVVDFFSVDAAPFQIESIVQEALSEKGASYDYWAVACFLTRMHPGSASGTRWFCSEFAYSLAIGNGIRLLSVPKDEAWRVDPTHFAWSPILHRYTGPLAA